MSVKLSLKRDKHSKFLDFLFLNQKQTYTRKELGDIACGV